MTTNTPILEIKNLTYALKDKSDYIYPSLDNTLSICRNTWLGIAGESGSGKSLLSMAISGIYEIPPGIISGSINFNFKDTSLTVTDKLFSFIQFKNNFPEKKFSAWRRHIMQKMRPYWGSRIGIMFQDSRQSLNPYLSIKAQMLDSIRHSKINNLDKEILIVNILNSVKIREPLKVLSLYPHELSGGMVQRIAIAMAILPNPEFTILDEPTIGMDVTIQAALTDLIMELREKDNTSGIIISHDLKFLSRVTERIAVMNAGIIFEIGDIHEIVHEEFPWHHPYTKYLLNPADHDKLNYFTSGLDHISTGCPFRFKCSIYNSSGNKLQKLCKNERPPFINVIKKHFVRCWHYQ